MKLDTELTASNATRCIEAAYLLKPTEAQQLVAWMVMEGDTQDCFVWTSSCLAVATGCDGVHPHPYPDAVLAAQVPQQAPLEMLGTLDRYARMARCYMAGDGWGSSVVFQEPVGRPGDAQAIGDLMAYTLIQARNAVIVMRRRFQ